LKNKTFQFNNLTIELHPEVYEPSEDTFQLIEAIKVKKDDNVLEIGTGCGLISLVCVQKGANVICTDINPFAIELTKKNFLVNNELLNGNYDIRIGDLFDVLNFDDKFDVIIFNPPYLPTKSNERIGGSGWFDKAVDGGIDGLNITKRFIEGLPKYLQKDGFAYFVFSSLSPIDKLEKYLKDSKLNFEILLNYRYNDEQLDIYQASIKK